MASSKPPSGTSTPSGFTPQTASAEDLLKSQTVGLVNLADFRKRRADVLELKEKEARDGARTPDSDGAVTGRIERDGRPAKKLKKKTASRGLLSFGDDDEGDDGGSAASTPGARSTRESTEASPDRTAVSRRKLTPNPNSSLPVPRAMTKAALAVEALEREKLRKEFLAIQERVKETEIEIPFVFYEAGANVPGGSVKLKKGDHVWLFLDRCRKVGAELGVSGSGSSGSGGGGTSTGQKRSREDSRKQWARVGVDDLMLVRNEVIVPHHYEFYYFIANKVPDPTRDGRLLFEYSGTADVETSSSEPSSSSLLRVPGQDQKALEGHDDDPKLTRVVDRRWYEKNKHIYPASLWKEYKPGKEFEDLIKDRKRDAQGNSFFFG